MRGMASLSLAMTLWFSSVGGLPALRSTTLPSGSKVAKFPLKATSPSRKSAPRPKALKAPRPTT